VRHFRRKFNAFMAEVRNQGYRRMHVFPAMPLSLAVELGRQVLPKADPTIGIWDLQDERFVPTLQLQV
jgi:SMODS-associated and fused to various effectors sensor domain